jgi:hypothetical protein
MRSTISHKIQLFPFVRSIFENQVRNALSDVRSVSPDKVVGVGTMLRARWSRVPILADAKLFYSKTSGQSLKSTPASCLVGTGFVYHR